MGRMQKHGTPLSFKNGNVWFVFGTKV